MPMARARLDWLVGMQSRNGGFAAFDADNTHYNLNYIPFADHGALLDPPTSDVTARVVTALALVGRPQDRAGDGACHRVSARRAGGRRLVVRALGNQLHLRHLVGADRRSRRPASAPTMRPCSARSAGSKRGRTSTAAGARATTPTRAGAACRGAHAEQPLPDGLGAAGVAGSRGRAFGCRARRHRIPAAHATCRWTLERSDLYRAGLPASVLSQVSRLLRVLSVLGAGGLPQILELRSRSLTRSESASCARWRPRRVI